MDYSIGNDRVSLCDEVACLHLRGDAAKVISQFIALFTLLAIISAVVKAIR
ncbi:MAG: hypothetical protein AAF765_00150 [Bacteroidota bacterium]